MIDFGQFHDADHYFLKNYGAQTFGSASKINSKIMSSTCLDGEAVKIFEIFFIDFYGFYDRFKSIPWCWSLFPKGLGIENSRKCLKNEK